MARRSPAYTPALGIPSVDHIQRAITEFRRVHNLNPNAPPLLVATEISLQQWLNPATYLEVRGVKFEALFRSDATSIDASTMTDLYIEWVVESSTHGYATVELVRQLTRPGNRHVLRPSVDITIVTNNHTFQPDVLLRPAYSPVGERFIQSRMVVDGRRRRV